MLLPATWTIPTAAATTETHLLSSCYRGMSTAATAPSLLYPTCSSSSSSSHDIVTSPLKSPLTSSNNHYQQQPQPQPQQPHQQQQYKSKSTTENEVITDTVPTRENMRHRVRFNPNHQCLLIDLTRLRVQQVEHVENIRSSIENVLVSNKAHNIHCLVNYDAFIIENDSLIEAYAKRVVKYISEQYYKSIQRYTTSHECHACILKLERMLEDLNVKLSKVYLGAEIIGDRYIVEECIGEGSFGRVKVAYDKITGEKVAVKELKLEQVRKLGIEDFVEREHEIMKQISSAPDAHENIVKWYDYIEEDDVIHIVLEYCANGPLERPDEEHEQFSEQKAHDYFVQIISALDYLHTRHHVMHRDLQLCNICTTDKDVVKIVDFGVADYFVPNEQKHTLFAGNVNYVPPEMTLTKRYVGPEIDTWSAGVCLYKMVTGYLPFRRVSDILIGKFSIPLEEEHDLSEECKDLIRHILNPDASKRYTIPMIKEHPWFKATTV